MVARSGELQPSYFDGIAGLGGARGRDRIHEKIARPVHENGYRMEAVLHGVFGDGVPGWGRAVVQAERVVDGRLEVKPVTDDGNDLAVACVAHTGDGVPLDDGVSGLCPDGTAIKRQTRAGNRRGEDATSEADAGDAARSGGAISRRRPRRRCIGDGGDLAHLLELHAAIGVSRRAGSRPITDALLVIGGLDLRGVVLRRQATHEHHRHRRQDCKSR
jgi:hypothetical protein